MGELKSLEEWKIQIDPVINSKVEEYHLMGYESITKDEVWKFIQVKLKKKQSEWLLHQAVAKIFELRVNDFMNWLTIEAFQNDSMFSA